MIKSGERFGGYELERRLRTDTASVLYRARDVRLQRTVALRIIPPTVAADAVTRARLNREATILASMPHPNVAPIYEAREEGDALLVATQWVDGIDLGTLVRREGPLRPSRAVRIVSQVASALQATHDKGVIHRDVKPSNVLVTPTDHVYLANFAFARRSSDLTGLTAQDELVGNFDCVAPEHIQGAKVDGRADIYGLGCVLYEALNGELPYPRSGSVARMYAHLSAEPPSGRDQRPQMADKLDAVVRRALAKDPDERQQTPAEFAIEAAAALEMSPPPWARRMPSAAFLPHGAESAELTAPEAEQQLSLRPAGDRTGSAVPAARRTASAQRVGAPEFSEMRVYRSGRRIPSTRFWFWAISVMVFAAAPVALVIALHAR